jgi:hypothetical protein
MKRWKAPDDVNRISVEGNTIEVDDVDHYDAKAQKNVRSRGVEVADHLDAHMRRIGFTPLAEPKKLGKIAMATDLKKVEEPKPGPTFQEFVDAGYLPEAYPPSGFESRHSPEELEQLRSAHAELLDQKKAGDGDDDVAAQAAAVAAQAAELKGMDTNQLYKWLTSRGVDASKTPNRPLRLQLALSTIGYVEPKKD